MLYDTTHQIAQYANAMRYSKCTNYTISIPYFQIHHSIFQMHRNPSLLTLGLTFLKLVTKSSNPIARISSRFVVSNASPNERNGPIAASFVNAVISDPENPTHQHIQVERGPSVIWTSCSSCSSVNV